MEIISSYQSWDITNHTLDIPFRQQIVNSSPELRALETRLQACTITRDNSAAIAEKEVHKKLRKVSFFLLFLSEVHCRLIQGGDQSSHR